MALGEKQLRSIREATGSVNLWEGSIRSGKTIGSLLRWVLFVAAAPTQGELVMVGRTRDAVWRNCLLPLQDQEISGANAQYVVGNFGAPTVSIFNRRVHVMGASDVKAERVLRGMTVAGAYADEVTTLPEEFFTQLLGRMSVRGAKLFGTTNPDGPRHWLKAKFLDKVRAGKLDNWRTWHFTMDDNPGLTETYKAQKRQEFTGLWFKRFIQGLWVQAEGAVYEEWDEDTMCVPYSSIPPLDYLLGVGVDYGTTNPTRGILGGVGHDRDGVKRLYLIDEWTPRKATDANLAESLKKWLKPGAHVLAGARDPWLFVDPAAASFRLQLVESDIMQAVAASNKVMPGIQVMHSLMSLDRLRVTDRCATFLEEVSGYVWDTKASDKGKDEVVKENDHTLDAARYLVYSTRGEWLNDIPLEIQEGDDDE